MFTITFDLIADVTYKEDKFSKVLLKKNCKFVVSKKNGFVSFNWDYLLLLAKIDFIIEKQNCKKNALIIYSTENIKMILLPLIEVVSIYLQIFKI